MLVAAWCIIEFSLTMSEICDVREHGARLQRSRNRRFLFFLPVYHGAFLKLYGTFFVCFLVGKDRGPVVISMRK